MDNQESNFEKVLLCGSLFVAGLKSVSREVRMDLSDYDTFMSKELLADLLGKDLSGFRLVEMDAVVTYDESNKRWIPIVIGYKYNYASDLVKVYNEFGHANRLVQMIVLTNDHSVQPGEKPRYFPILGGLESLGCLTANDAERVRGLLSAKLLAKKSMTEEDQAHVHEAGAMVLGLIITSLTRPLTDEEKLNIQQLNKRVAKLTSPPRKD